MRSPNWGRIIVLAMIAAVGVVYVGGVLMVWDVFSPSHMSLGLRVCGTLLFTALYGKVIVSGLVLLAHQKAREDQS